LGTVQCDAECFMARVRVLIPSPMLTNNGLTDKIVNTCTKLSYMKPCIQKLSIKKTSKT